MKVSTSLFCLILALLLVAVGCQKNLTEAAPQFALPQLPANMLDYRGTPDFPMDRSSLAFSDQGAWFAYGLPAEEDHRLGFTGPFLMTQGQGEWSSKSLSQLELLNPIGQDTLDLATFSRTQYSYNSHLQQLLESDRLKIEQSLFFSSAHSALMVTTLTNLGTDTITLQPIWNGKTLPTRLKMVANGNAIDLITDRSPARGRIQTFDSEISSLTVADSSYTMALEALRIAPQQSQDLLMAHSFVFPEYNAENEQTNLKGIAANWQETLDEHIYNKRHELLSLELKLDSTWQDKAYKNLLAKTVLTLQNNSRIPAGELKHAGLFPSYHYKWFLGYWAWDSWKHAVALAHYKPDLAKDQIRAMYDFMDEDGFIADCVYRDTTLERHNYRNTKPPLSGWAVWNVYRQSGELGFIEELYPKVVKQHNWWYTNRDHDRDGICEYGSTDGTLIAAKWESGMDNAVRFDDSSIVQNGPNAYSLDQESVDLNAFLYAEKLYLARIAEALGNTEEASTYKQEAEALKANIRQQFYDEESGWFYDTNLKGDQFIKAKGSEGWIPLWAKVATPAQVEAMLPHLRDPEQFNTKVPLPTLSADHPKFKPDKGYWRGPNWLDQAYFGIRGLHNYGYHPDAYFLTARLIHNAAGVLEKGPSIRENYHPLTGAGMESKNFSWSAAHYLLLLINE